MKRILIPLIALVFTSCDSTKAVFDYDETVDFTNKTTYAVYPDLVSNLNQLDEQRVLSILQTEMPLKGFNLAENPQILVNFYAAEYEAESGEGLGIGIGGGGGNMGVGVSGGIPIGGRDSFIVFTLDFIDAEEDTLIWQAEVDGKFNKDTTPQLREARLREIIKKALEGYPPKRK